MECGLDTPESNRVSHRGLDKVGQGFALPEYGFKLSAQLGLDADLGYDGGLHQSSVLRLSYAGNGSLWCGLVYVTAQVAGQQSAETQSVRPNGRNRLGAVGRVGTTNDCCFRNLTFVARAAASSPLSRRSEKSRATYVLTNLFSLAQAPLGS